MSASRGVPVFVADLTACEVNMIGIMLIFILSYTKAQFHTIKMLESNMATRMEVDLLSSLGTGAKLF